MATTRLMPLHTGKGRTVGQAIRDIIDYTENPQKTDGGRLITSWQCDSRIADAEFLFAKNQYIQKTGRVRGEDDVIAYHLRQSFVPGEITPEEANRLGCELAKRSTRGNHAYIVCTHIDKSHIHNHVIWNSTALSQTRKFRNFWGSSHAVRRLNDTICIENGYSIVENPKQHGRSYNKWLGDQKKPSHRERICAAIDDALAQKPDSFEALLELLRLAGYEVKGKKVPSLLGGEQKRSIRMDTLGAGYTPEDLRAVIAGEKTHTPRKRHTKPATPEKKSGNLLVDIQAKLRADKGAGYARWATLFNLKQMAQTVAYLQENELLDYDTLSEKAAAASAHFNDLSAKIKSAEMRMAEITVLRKHIVNYAKTRDTYAAYREAGYSKKFLAEHESEITLHKAAKQHFDELGVKKLPTIKALNTEYAALMAEKKVAYSEYRKTREDMKELLAPSGVRGRNWFSLLMDRLPETHKARWFAGAALNSSEQAMASVMSTVLSRLNAFLDSELEQVLCFDSAINAEQFAAEKSAIFLILPEEDTTKNFMAGLMIQTLARELFAVADDSGGRLPNRVVFFCDELGTMPAFDILPLFSAGRSRGLTMVPIIQALAQLEKNYGKEGSEIIQDNCQDTIFGGFAPNSQTAEQLSKSLGSRTVLSGSVSKGKNDPSQSLQMMERPLMTPDELKSIPKGSFVVMKNGTHPMQTKLRLFLDRGITFDAIYATPEHAARPVAYASRAELLDSIDRTYPKTQPALAPSPGKRETHRQRSGQTYEEGTP